MNRVSLALIGFTVVGALSVAACGSDATPQPTVTVTAPAPATTVVPGSPAPTTPAPTTPAPTTPKPTTPAPTVTYVDPDGARVVQRTDGSGGTLTLPNGTTLNYTGDLRNNTYSTSPMKACLTDPTTTLADCQGLSVNGTTGSSV